MLNDIRLINEEVLCVLKKKRDGEFYVDHVPLYDPFPEKMMRIHALLNDEGTAPLDIYKDMLCDDQLKAVWQYHHFSDILYIAYGELNYKSDYCVKELSQTYTTRADKVKFVKKRILAFLLGQSYNHYSTDTDVLAYSHRIIGWCAPRYKLSEDFSIGFKTNFGYGTASHFYTRLRYKEIDIVPFSHFVTYRYVDKRELVLYSASYPLENRFWQDAMTYGRDACNLYRQDPLCFMYRYIKDECDKLIAGLNDVASKQTFTLIYLDYRFVKYFQTVTFEGRELDIFRGERISGALHFIESLRALEKLFYIQSVISRIEQHNQSFAGQLRSKIPQAERELAGLRNNHEGVEQQLEALKPTYREYQSQEKAYRQQVKDDGTYDQTKFSEMFAERYPDYAPFMEKYWTLDKKLGDLRLNILDLERYLDKLREYDEEIKNYFEAGADPL